MTVNYQMIMVFYLSKCMITFIKPTNCLNCQNFMIMILISHMKAYSNFLRISSYQMM
jgi:hypothetical protein